MSFCAFFSSVGAVAGTGFGIYAAVQNFDADEHQAESMNEATRFFSELLTQIANVALQAGSLALLSGTGGVVLDLLTCGLIVTEAERHKFEAP